MEADGQNKKAEQKELIREMTGKEYCDGYLYRVKDTGHGGKIAIMEKELPWRRRRHVRLPGELDGLPVKALIGTFERDTEVETVVIPGTVAEIWGFTFAGCSRLAFVYLSEGIRKIENRAFFSCPSLCRLWIPATVTCIEKDAFAECPEVTLMVAPGSCGEAYAVEHGIPFCCWEGDGLPEEFPEVAEKPDKGRKVLGKSWWQTLFGR